MAIAPLAPIAAGVASTKLFLRVAILLGAPAAWLCRRGARTGRIVFVAVATNSFAGWTAVTRTHGAQKVDEHAARIRRGVATQRRQR
jgi:hypothetical protein